MAKRLLSTQRIVNLAADPATGTAGEIYYNTVSNSFKYYDGSAWVAFSSGSGSGVPIGGTGGQILAKIDETNYNTHWIDNIANYTSQVKHNVKAAEAINKGQAVYVSSANGENIIVSKASNSSEVTSSKTMGLLEQNLSTNGTGFVVTEGLISGLNTSSATAGDPVWLGTNGNLLYGTANKPAAPIHTVFIGIVTRVQQNNDQIFVKVQNGFELQELHNVLINGIGDNHILSYDNATSLWKNQSLYSAIQDIGDVAISGDLSLAEGKILKIGGNPILSAAQYAGNAATVTNGLYSSSTYTDPAWLSTLSWSKITNTPTTLLSYGIVDITGTKQYLELGNVENTALSTWAGSGNITSLGTITSGIWNASVIANSYIASEIARLNSPIFTGTVTLPTATSIGNVTATEITYLDGVTSSIQTQINNKLDSAIASTTYAPLNSPTFSGTVDLSSATVLGLVGLPSQTNNSGKYLTTNGSAPSWATLSALRYSATEPVSPSTGDIWVESDVDIAAFDPHQYVRWYKTLTQTTSSFNGTSSNGILLSYTPGFEQVFLNGVLLLRNTDYTATDGSTVVLSESAVINDVIEIIALNVFNVANTYTTSQVDSLLSAKADASSLTSKANISSPTFTGTPAAPTANVGTNTTQIATTAFVSGTIDNEELLIIAGAL